MFLASGTVRTEKIPGRSMPGSGGRIGAAPGDSTSLSYFSVVTSPVTWFLSSTVFCCGEMPTTSQRVRHIDRELLAKRLFRRHQEARLFFNHAADMVRQSAVRVRNIRPAFDHEDFGFFVQPAQARRTRCAAGHSANDDDFHFLIYSPC